MKFKFLRRGRKTGKYRFIFVVTKKSYLIEITGRQTGGGVKERLVML